MTHRAERRRNERERQEMIPDIFSTFGCNDQLTFNKFYEQVTNLYKDNMIKNPMGPPPFYNALAVYFKATQLMNIIGMTNNIFTDVRNWVCGNIDYLQPDYYVIIHQGWAAATAIVQQRLLGGYKPRFIAKLPDEDKREALVFIGGSKKDDEWSSIMYEIIRERRNDRSSKVLRLEKIANSINDREHQIME